MMVSRRSIINAALALPLTHAGVESAQAAALSINAGWSRFAAAGISISRFRSAIPMAGAAAQRYCWRIAIMGPYARVQGEGRRLSDWRTRHGGRVAYRRNRGNRSEGVGGWAGGAGDFQ